MQFFELGLEHIVEGGAQHAAELVLAFGKATDPEVNIVQARVRGGPGAGAVQEVQTFSFCGQRLAWRTEHKRHGGIAFCGKCSGAGDGGVRSIRSDEVDNRRWILQIRRHARPTGERRELAVAGGGEKGGAGFVETG